MQIEFDEKRWPDLTRFRKACLADDVETMTEIVQKEHDWYHNENPGALSLDDLAKLYQAQHYSSEGDLEKLKHLQRTATWVLNHPWTAQKWLPLSQAVCSTKNRTVVQFLLDHGADPQAIVGDPGEKASIPDMAR